MKRPKLTAGQRLGMAFITAFAIFIYNCTTDQMRDSPKTAHIPKNPPRPEHAKNISEDEARTAGPLEVSFCPEIPQGLYFGDSPETVIAKMGREPDEQLPTVPGTVAYNFFFGPPDNLPSQGTPKFQHLCYIFKYNKLSLIIANHYGFYEAALQSKLKVLESETSIIQQFLEHLYGRSGVSNEPSYDVPGRQLSISFWELKSNALLFSFNKDEPDKNRCSFVVLVCQLKASGRYVVKELRNEFIR